MKKMIKFEGKMFTINNTFNIEGVDFRDNEEVLKNTFINQKVKVYFEVDKGLNDTSVYSLFSIKNFKNEELLSSIEILDIDNTFYLDKSVGQYLPNTFMRIGTIVEVDE